MAVSLLTGQQCYDTHFERLSVVYFFKAKSNLTHGSSTPTILIFSTVVESSTMQNAQLAVTPGFKARLNVVASAGCKALLQCRLASRSTMTFHRQSRFTLSVVIGFSARHCCRIVILMRVSLVSLCMWAWWPSG